MAVYCIDTSSLISAWQERYPVENFPLFWQRIDGLINAGRLVAPDEVLREITKRSDDLHTWLKNRPKMFRDLEEAIQVEASQILGKFPHLVGERKMRTSADPFVIALAKVEGYQIVTEERPTGKIQSPHIPDVCAALGMTTMGMLQLIRAEKWVVG